jgi:DNA replication protein DnaC
MNDDNYRRRGGPARLGDLVDDVTAWLPKLTDAQWADRDAVVAEAKRRQADRERENALHLRADLLRQSGFGNRAVDTGLAEALAPAKATEAMRLAHDFIASNFGRDNERNVLILAGGTGTGKTSAAALCALLSPLSAPALIRAGMLERRGRYDRGELGPWLDSRSLLVIDDLGTEPLDGKGYFVALLDEIVDRFHDDRKPLVITTNLAVRRAKPDEQPQIEERYEARIVSRLLESATWAACGNHDLRRGQR